MPVTLSTAVIQRGLNAAFRPAFQNAVTMRGNLCVTINSDGAYETYRWLGQNPGVKEWKDRATFKALNDFGFTLNNKDWYTGIQIDRNTAKDDQTGQIDERGRTVGERFAQAPDSLLTTLIENGDSEPCYDGQSFFDTDHEEGDSGPQSNKLTYPAATGTTPTIAEFEASFWQAAQALVGFKDDQGLPWNYITNFNDISGLLVYVPPALIEVATKTLGINAVVINSNTTNILSGKCTLVINPFSTWSNEWALFNTRAGERPFIFQNREQPTTSLIDDPRARYLEYLVTGRYNVGYGLWQHGVKTQFT